MDTMGKVAGKELETNRSSWMSDRSSWSRHPGSSAAGTEWGGLNARVSIFQNRDQCLRVLQPLLSSNSVVIRNGSESKTWSQWCMTLRKEFESKHVALSDLVSALSLDNSWVVLLNLRMTCTGDDYWEALSRYIFLFILIIILSSPWVSVLSPPDQRVSLDKHFSLREKFSFLFFGGNKDTR